MNTELTNVKDAVIVELMRFNDERGFFEELYSFNDERGFFEELYSFPRFSCLQINCSWSVKNVLRGMHVAPFAKLVHCIKGSILDVVVDMRKDSTTYLEWHIARLNEANKKSFYIPANCAHGFLVLEDSYVVYAQDGLYDPKTEYSIRYDSLGITWPVGDFILSEKDRNAPRAS